MSERIKVAVWCWPLSEQENQANQKAVVKLDNKSKEIFIENQEK